MKPFEISSPVRIAYLFYPASNTQISASNVTLSHTHLFLLFSKTKQNPIVLFKSLFSKMQQVASR
jgi:hypothetical protein